MVIIKNVIIFCLIISTNAFSFSPSSRISDSWDTSRYDLYGPAIIPYCDGFIEAYIRRIWGNYQLMIKPTPPKGHNWVINNSHVLIVDTNKKDKPFDYDDFYEINTKDSKETQVQFDIKGHYKNRVNQFGVSFKNIDGCPTKEQKGSILKISSKF